jgi:hypothetical protein
MSSEQSADERRRRVKNGTRVRPRHDALSLAYLMNLFFIAERA